MGLDRYDTRARVATPEMAASPLSPSMDYDSPAVATRFGNEHRVEPFGAPRMKAHRLQIGLPSLVILSSVVSLHSPQRGIGCGSQLKTTLNTLNTLPPLSVNRSAGAIRRGLRAKRW